MTLACRVACVCRGNGGEGRGGGEGVGPAVGKLWECSKSRPTWSEPLRQPWLRTHSAFRPRSFFFGQGNNKKVNFVLFCFEGAYWGACDVSVVSAFFFVSKIGNKLFAKKTNELMGALCLLFCTGCSIYLERLVTFSSVRINISRVWCTIIHRPTKQLTGGRRNFCVS